MLHLIPAPLHRLALQTAHRGRKLYWRIARPRIQGVCIVATDAQGHILFARHSYGTGNWLLPAGGMRRGEEPLATAQREIGEELRCTLWEPHVIAVHGNTLFGARHTQHLIAGQLVGTPQPDGREVLEARFFAPDALPDPIGARTLGQLELWREFTGG